MQDRENFFGGGLWPKELLNGLMKKRDMAPLTRKMVQTHSSIIQGINVTGFRCLNESDSGLLDGKQGKKGPAAVNVRVV